MLTHLLTLYAALRRHLNYLRTVEADFLDGRSIEPIYAPPLPIQTAPVLILESFDSSRADAETHFLCADWQKLRNKAQDN